MLFRASGIAGTFPRKNAKLDRQFRSDGVDNKQHSSSKQVTVRARPLESNVGVLFCQRINKKPIRFEVTVAAAEEFATQRMIFKLRRQGFAVDQKIERGLEFRHVFATLFRALYILLELGRATEVSHSPISA